MTRVAEMWGEIFRAAYVSPVLTADLYVIAGNAEKALDWMEKGFEVRDPNLPYLGVAPLVVDLLKDEPRYHALMRKMNLPPLK
jgi:hypothetical protein